MFVESLEERMLLTAAPLLDGDLVEFFGSLDVDSLYLSADESGSLQYSETGAANSFTSDLDANLAGVQSLALSELTQIDIDLGTGSDEIFIDDAFQNAIATLGGTLTIGSDVLADSLTGPDGAWQIAASGRVGLGEVEMGTAAIVGGSNSLSIETTGDVNVLGDLYTEFDLALSAGQGISIVEGVTVSSRQIAGSNHLTGNSSGDSRSLEFSAPIIDVGAGARILAHANGALAAGDVTLSAHDDATGFDTPTIEIDIVNSEARITLDDATVTGRNIQFSAVAESASRFYDDESPTEATLNFLDGLSEVGGVAITNALAEIQVGTGTTIDGNQVELVSRADTESNITTLGTALAVAYGESNPHARIMIQDGVSITSAGDLTLNSLADSHLDVTAKQALYPQKPQSSIDITLAAGLADIQSQVEVAGNASLTSGGDIAVVANMLQSQNVRSSAAAYEDGAVGGAVAYSHSVSDVHAFVDGTVNANGSVEILATSSTPKNDAASQAGVGSGFVASKIIQADDAVSLTERLNAFMGKAQPEADSSSGGTQKFALAAAFTYFDHANNTVARIGDIASVTAATGSVDVSAEIESVPENSAITSVDSDRLNASTPKGNTKENSNAVSVVVANLDNSTEAYVGEAATVDAYTDLTVRAETRLPHEIDWHEVSTDSVADKLNANLGIQNGIFTSWSQSNATGTKTAIAASLNFQTFDTSSHAYIAKDASVNENLDSDQQHVRVEAQNVVEAVHLAGNIGLPFGQTTGGSGAGGGYLQTVYNNRAEAEVRTGATVLGSSLFVSADSKTRNISLAISGGVADDLAFNGAGSLARVDNRTIARIDDGATVVTDNALLTIDTNGEQKIALDTDGDGLVTAADRNITSASNDSYEASLNQLVVAEDETSLFNLSGGVTKSQSVGIGFSVGINEVTRNTQALIGNEVTTISNGAFSPSVGVDSLGNIQLGYNHGFSTGDEVIYSSGGGDELVGLTSGESYVVTVVDATTVRLEKSLAAASDAIETFFVPASDVDGSDNIDAIDLGYVHNYATGDLVVYRSGGGQAIGGLIDGEKYYVIVVDATTVALAASQESAGQAANIAFAIANVDGAADTIDLSTTHGFRTGDTVVYAAGGGTSVGGLVDGQTYFVRVSDSESIHLADSAEAALLGENLIELNPSAATGSDHRLRRDVRIELDGATATGSSHNLRLSVAAVQSTNISHALVRTFDAAANSASEHSLDLGYQHGFTTGQAVVYENGGGESIGGLASGETYFVVVVNGTTIQLADTQADALATDAVVLALDASSATGGRHGFGGAFRDRPSVDGASNTINFGGQHGFSTGDAVTYDAAGGAAFGGLVDGQTYYAIVVDSNTVQLASSEANASSATAIDLDASSAGNTSHALRGVDDSDGSITSGGNIRLAAMNHGTIGSISLAGALTNDSPTGTKKTQSKEAANAKTKATKGVSVAGDISLNTVSDTTMAAIRDASVTANNDNQLPADIGLTAENRANIYAGSGSVAIASAQSSSAGLAGSYTVNTIHNETSAVIENADTESTTGDVYVQAASNGEIRSLSASGSGVTRNALLSIAGQVSINQVVSTTDAHISEGSEVAAAGDVDVSAIDNSLVHAIAGAATFGGKLGVGAAIASNRVQSTTTASVSDSQLVVSGGLTLDAASDSEIQAITAAVGANTQGLTVEFGVAINSIANETTAQLISIADDEGVAVGTDLLVTAADSATILAITGGLAASSGTAGVGGGYGRNSVRNKVAAGIEDAIASAQGSLDVRATSAATIKSITVGGAGAQAFAAGGSWSRNEVRNEIEASIRNSDVRAFNADGLNIDVVAMDDATIQAISGGAAIATAGVSVGAAVAENVVANSSKAIVDGSLVQSDSGAVIVDASSAALIETITVGGAGGQTFALGGSFSFNDVQNVIDARISNASEVTASGNVQVEGEDTATIRGIAGSVAVATGVAAVGVSLATNDIQNTVSSHIDGSTVEATAGHILVDAKSTSLVKTISAGVAASQNEASGGVSLNEIDNSIRAFITTSDIVAENGIQLTADDDATIEALSGKAGGASTASFGGSAALNEIGNTIHAYADNSTMESATGSIEVLAQSRATIITISASGSIAGAVSVTGSIATSSIENDVQAYLDATDANAYGNVTVVADSLNDANTYAGTIQIGGTLGIGGSYADTKLDNSTKAYIVDSNVDAAGNGTSLVPNTDGSNTLQEVQGVAVVAISTGEINVLIGNGSGGGVGAVAATLSFQTSDDTTEVYITRSDINTDETGSAGQDVLVSALGETSVDVKAGGLGIGGTVGVGATHDKTIITNTTKAYVDDQSLVFAQGDVNVTAISEERINSISLSGAISASVAIAGNVAINEVESTTEAFVEGSTIRSQDDVNVAARSDTFLGVKEDGNRLGILSGAVGIDFSLLGVGGAVSDNSISNSTSARIDNSRVNAESIAVTADSYEDVISLAISGAGSLSVAAIANYANANSDSTTTASIGENAFISARDDVMLTANAGTKADAQAYGVAGGLILAGGATFADAVASPTAIASVEAGTSVAAGDDVTIKSSSTSNVSSDVIGAGAGLATGSLVQATSEANGSTKVVIGEGAQIVARDVLDVSAETRIDVDSESESLAIAGAALGASSSDSTVNAETVIDIGAFAELIGRVTKVHATATQIDANATAIFDSTISLATAAKAEATVLANAVAEVISRGADIAGYDLLEIIARQTGVSSRTDSQVDAGIVPFVDSISRNNVDLDSNVDVQAGSVLRGTDVVVDAASANLVGYERLADVDSLTITALEGALSAAQSVLNGANSVLNSALNSLTSAQNDLADAQADLQTAEDYLEDKQDALDAIILDLCGSNPSTACLWVWRVTLSPFYLALEAAQLAVNTAQGAVSAAQTAVNGAQNVVNSAQSAVNSALAGVTNAFNNLNAAFGAESSGSARKDNDVKLNGDLYVGAVSDRLVINPDGTISGGATGIDGQVVAGNFELDEIVASDLVTANTASLLVKSIGGSLSGNLKIHEDVALAGLSIVNNSGTSLRVNDIATTSTNTISTTVTKQASSNSLTTPIVSQPFTAKIDVVNGDQQAVVVAGDVSGGNRNLQFTTDADLVIDETIVTSSFLTVASTDGSISDSNSSGPSLTAGTLSLLAANGSIGSASAAIGVNTAQLETVIAAGLVAVNDKTGDLTAHSVTSTEGDVLLNVDGGTLRVETIQAANGDASLTAFGSVIDVKSGNAANVVANNISIESITGRISAVVDLAHASDGQITASAASYIELNATNGDIDLGRLTSDTAVVFVHHFDGDIRATEDISAELGIGLVSQNGSIIIGSDVVLETPATGANSTIYLEASEDVRMADGSLLDAYSLILLAGNNGFVNTSVEQINAETTGSGDIFIREQDDVVLDRVVAADGSVHILADGTITAHEVRSTNDAAGRNVGLISRSGDIVVGEVQAGSANGQVSLSAAGNITAANTDELPEVVVGLVVMNAGGSIDVGTEATEQFEFADGKTIRVKTDRSLELFLHSTANVFAIADGDINAKYVETAGVNINLKSNDANVYLGTLTTTHGNGRIKIQANGTDGQGNIVQSATLGGDGAAMTASKSIDLRAKGGVAIGGRIEARQNNVTISATDDLTIAATATIQAGNLVKATTRFGNINIQGEIAATKTVDIRSKGDLMINGSISTEQKDVKLNANGRLDIADAAQLAAGNNASLKTRTGDVSVFGAIFAGLFGSRSTRGNIRIDAGGVADVVDAELDALGEVTVVERGR